MGLFRKWKKARISYDSTNGLKLEVAKAESKWIYGLHNNTPTTADRTNQGGFAIISENGLSKLYINGYHYDENKITYNPTLYKTELYKMMVVLGNIILDGMISTLTKDLLRHLI